MKIITSPILILCLLVIGCTENKKNTTEKNQAKMELLVLSNDGDEEKIISNNTTVNQIKQTMSDLNWNQFHQVILSTDNNNWIQVGGNLNEDGLSTIYEENGKQFVIIKPPTSIDHLTDMLVSYFNGDGKYKKENVFE